MQTQGKRIIIIFNVLRYKKIKNEWNGIAV